MQKLTIDPWKWAEGTNSVQAVEIKQCEGTLYCSGQVAIDANGIPSSGDMREQFSCNEIIYFMQNMEIARICPKSRTAWREWLAENSSDKQAVWLVYYKKKSESTTLTWTDAVEEALCFGWIDGVRKTIDVDSFMQYFCKRKAKNTWSKINKLKVQSLIEQGMFTAAGHKSIEIAKSNGSWSILDDVEELIIPLDLERGFESKPGSKEFFLSLSKSKKKELLQSLVLAGKAETRQARIIKIVELA